MSLELNWTSEVISGLVVTCIFFIRAALFTKFYREKRHLYLLLFLVNAILMIFQFLFISVAVLLMSKFLFTLGAWSLGINLCTAVAFYDVTTHERIGTWKMMLAGMLFMIFMFASVDQTSVVDVVLPTGEAGLALVGYFLVNWIVCMGVIAVCIYVPLLRMYYHAPPKLKRPASTFILSFSLMIASIVEYALGNPLPWFTNVLIGTLEVLNLWVFTKWHQLGFILPFKVCRLTVLSTISGIPLFDYSWSQKNLIADDALYGAMLQGVTTIFQQELGRGKAHEIILEKGTLILNHAENRQVVFILLATNITKTLRQALDFFAKRFFQQYDLTEFIGGDTSQFAGADEIVKECFGFIPE
jgi:hypothetical protein